MRVSKPSRSTEAGAASVSLSSLIPATAGQFPDPMVKPGEVPADLLAALGSVPDVRARRGVRHRFTAILGIAVCAVLAGARSYVAIAEWAHDLTPTVRLRLGLGRRAPSESTVRRVLQRVDPEALDRVTSSWLAARSRPREPTRVIAVDGKSARGARGVDGRAVHLLAAFDTATGVVLGQAVVDGKTNEINAFAPLLDRVDIAGAIVTADAMHTQRAHVAYLTGRGAHYLLTVKGNQPKLLAQLRRLPWGEVPVADDTTDKAHGRLESRTVKVTAISAGIAFPGAALAIQVTRRRRPPRARRWRTETVYAVTDLTEDQVSPAELADAVRAHWGIENRLHWIRDVTFAEDLSQVRAGHGPVVMATLRNLAISLHRRSGAGNIAAACRHVSRHPNRVLPLLL
jgi:predicted transposase YbfD/YdcC